MKPLCKGSGVVYVARRTWRWNRYVKVLASCMVLEKHGGETTMQGSAVR